MYKSKLNTWVIFILFLLCSKPIFAQIVIHTDNKSDFVAFNNNNLLHNLSTTTNLYALGFSSKQIKFEYMTTTRSLSYMDKGKNICIFNKVKTTSRAKKYLFSQPINLFIARRLYQHAGFPPLPEATLPNTQINLATLFNHHPESRLIVSKQISYGNFLDRLLTNINEHNKFIRHSGEHDKGVISMFAKGRAEFALLYPHQVFVFDSTINARSYEIADLKPYELGHLMCSKTQENKTFINEINEHLRLEKNRTELLNIHLSFINSVDKKIFTQYFHQVFRN